MTIPYTKQGAPFVDDPVLAAATFNASKANAMDQGIYEAQLQPAVRVFHNAAQGALNNTNLVLAFNSERFDQASGAASTQHDTVTNNTRLTALYAGVYQITGNIEWASNAAGVRDLFIRLNGTAGIAYTRLTSVAAVLAQQSLTTLYAMAVNDYVELVAFQNSGSTVNVNSTTNFSPEFMMVRVA